VEFSSSLKKNYDFRRVYRRGKSAVTPRLVLYCRPCGRKTNRLGITVSVKLGGAVTRNRVRRRVREIYRTHEAEFLPGFDLVAVARTRAVDAEYRELERDFLALAGKLGVRK